MRRHVGGMPLLTDLSLAMRTDPLALIRGATELEKTCSYFLFFFHYMRCAVFCCLTIFSQTIDPCFVGRNSRSVTAYAVCLHGLSNEKANKQRSDSEAREI